MKFILHYVIFFVLLILQTVLSRYISFGGVFPNLILVYVICLCLKFADIKSIVLATIAGLVLDLYKGQTIGYNALFFMYFAIATSFFSMNFFRGKSIVTLLYTAVATIVYEVMYYILFFGIWNNGGSFTNVTYTIFMEVVCNVICVLPLYYIIKKTDVSGLNFEK